MNAPKGVVEVEYDSDSISFEERKSFQSRNALMIALIDEAWGAFVRGGVNRIPKKKFSLHTDDGFCPQRDYSFAVSRREDVARCMPSFIFHSWPECGIDSYEQVFSQMASGEDPPSDERVFWIGNVSCPLRGYDNRRMGLSVAAKHLSMCDFRSIQWSVDQADPKSVGGYVSLMDHRRYRVLIDFGGLGFSARIPLLLASGRPVILVGHPQEAWFYWDGSLVPWVHFVPCGSLDGSDVNERAILDAIRWTFENRDECAKIGAGGREYAMRFLTRSAAVERIGRMLLGHSAANH